MDIELLLEFLKQINFSRHSRNQVIYTLLQGLWEKENLIKEPGIIKVLKELNNLNAILKQEVYFKAVDNEDYFYEIGISSITKATKNNTIRFAAKTPALILPSEWYTQRRKEYYYALYSKLISGSFQAKYVFSKPRTIKALKLITQDQTMVSTVLSTLRQVIELLHYENLDLRYLPNDDFISCIISESQVVYLWKSPVLHKSIGVFHIIEKTLIGDFKRYYDLMFEKAIRVTISEVENWIESLFEKI